LDGLPSFQEQQQVGARVAELEAEIETLKADLYRTKQSEEALLRDQADLEQRARANDQAAGGREERKTESGGEREKAEEEALLREVRDLENMVRMYEKENVRLADALAQKDKELKTARADFFDKQEALVKQVNRLQNQCHGVSANLETAPIFDMATRNFEDELERDALFRNMSEQIAYLEKTCRKRDESIAEMTDALNASEREKIVLERALSAATGGKGTAGFSVSSWQRQSGSQQPMFHCQRDDEAKGGGAAEEECGGSEESLRALISRERAEHKHEIEALQKKLRWFAETQELVDAVKAERDGFKRDLVKLMNSRQQQQQQQGDLDTSNVTASSVTPGHATHKRSPADVRRIRYELQRNVVVFSKL
jgi:hypothetical protein